MTSPTGRSSRSPGTTTATSGSTSTWSRRSPTWAFSGRSSPRSTAAAGLDYLTYGLIVEEVGRGDSSAAHRRLGPDVPRLQLDRALGHRGAEARVAPAPLLRRDPRLLRPDRAEHRVGRGEPVHPREEDRRWLVDLRPEAVDLDGQLREGRARLRPDRPGEEAQGPRRLPRPHGHRRLLLERDPREARAARVGHGRALPGRCRGSGRSAARRRRRRLQGRDERARLRPLQRRRGLRRHLPGLR